MKRLATAGSFLLALFVTCSGAIAAGKASRPAKADPPATASGILVPLSFEQLIAREKTVPVAEGKGMTIAYSPDGAKMAAGGEDKVLALYDGRTNELQWSLKDLPVKTTFLCFTGNGAYLAATGREKEVILLHAAKGGMAGVIRLNDDVRSLSCSSQRVAAALDDKSIVLLDPFKLAEANAVPAGEGAEGITGWFRKLTGRKKEQEQEIHAKAVAGVLKLENEEPLSVLFSPDGSLLASGTKNRHVVLWDVKKRAPARMLEGVEKDTTRLAFDRSSALLAAVEDRKRIALWNLNDPAKPQILKREKGDDILSLAFSPDGSLLAAGEKKRVVLWSVQKPREVYRFPEQEKDLTALAFSPDGRGLAVAEEKQIVLWTFPGIVRIAAGFSAAEERAALERERDTKIEALATVKGEFETTKEYEARVRKAKSDEAAVRREYDQRIRNAAQHREEELAQLRKRLYPYAVHGELGAYDADSGTFSAKIGERSVRVAVPPSQAKRIAQHRDKVSFAGMIRYHSADRVEFVNGALVDRDTGSRFPFGVQVAGGALPEPVAPAAAVAMGQRRALPQLDLATVSFSEPSGFGSLNAGESGAIKVTIRNGGSGDAEGVQLSVDGVQVPRGVRYADRVFVGRVAAGETRAVDVEVVAGEDIPGEKAVFKLTALDQDGFDSRPVGLEFTTRALVAPQLRVARIDFADSDSRRVITKGKEVNITATAANSGGVARNVRAVIEIGDMNIKLFSDPEIALGTMKPGESRKVVFTIAVTQRYNGDSQLPIDIVLQEERPRYSARLPVRLALNQEAPDMKLVKVEAKEAPRTTVDDEGAVPVLALHQRAFGENDVAVVIGIERYQTIPPSEYSSNDARAVKRYLLSLGFAERNIEVLTDERATLSAIRKSLETWLPNRVKAGSRVFIYYSGHGAPDLATGEAFLVPFDGDPGYLNDTGYPVKRLYEKLGKSGASENIVVIDSCFSGTGGRSVLAKGARPLVLMAEGPVIPPNVVVLSSTQGAQISTSYAEKEHGMFTWYFLKALREGKQDVAEIYTYVKPLVEDGAKRQNVEQIPAVSRDPAKLTGKFIVRK